MMPQSLLIENEIKKIIDHHLIQETLYFTMNCKKHISCKWLWTPIRLPMHPRSRDMASTHNWSQDRYWQSTTRSGPQPIAIWRNELINHLVKPSRGQPLINTYKQVENCPDNEYNCETCSSTDTTGYEPVALSVIELVAQTAGHDEYCCGQQVVLTSLELFGNHGEMMVICISNSWKQKLDHIQ